MVENQETRPILEEVKMKLLMLFLTCMLLAIPSQAADKEISETQGFISGRRQAIENSYSDRLTELRLSAQANIRLLEVAEQPKPDCVGLDQWCEFAEAVLQINGIANDGYDFVQISAASPAQSLAAALSRIAKRKNDILAEMEWQTVKLKRQKNYALTAGLAQLEKRQKEISLATEPDTTHGVITGIIYSDDDPVAIIDGTIVRDNGEIHGVKIVKIHKDSVEFDRNNKTWTQHVQEIQQANWK